jgi:hypothetical protein
MYFFKCIFYDYSIKIGFIDFEVLFTHRKDVFVIKMVGFTHPRLNSV